MISVSANTQEKDGISDVDSRSKTAGQETPLPTSPKSSDDSRSKTAGQETPLPTSPKSSDDSGGKYDEFEQAMLNCRRADDDEQCDTQLQCLMDVFGYTRITCTASFTS